MIITPEQVRAARALLRLEQKNVAERAGLSPELLDRLEQPGGIQCVAPEAVEAVRRALESAGAEFIDRGVRTKPPRTPEQEELFQRLLEISRRSAALVEGFPSSSENDLYDENGLPA
jgi:transcriptional regulator with XRE-family HTH domain